MVILRKRRQYLKAIVLFVIAFWFLVAWSRKSEIKDLSHFIDSSSRSNVSASIIMNNNEKYYLNEHANTLENPVNISKEKYLLIQTGWRLHNLNQFVSDLISVKRELPDMRHEWCKKPGRYLKDLPQTSVVICFHNEAWSVLLRTIHSVLDRSPPHLIKEVILVDDYSNMTHLKQRLKNYMSALHKVRIVRANRRQGLIRARLLGARYVTAPVLTYLDSHCECTEGWLEPLLDKIARDNTAVVFPIIDVINRTTFEYMPSKQIVYGGLDWSMEYKPQYKNFGESSEPLWSPTMPGGLFTIKKDFFEKLETNDSTHILGAENFELSFKIWVCGGTLEVIPCSHVGHVYKNKSPLRLGSDDIWRNFIRVVEVWLDDYKTFFYLGTGVSNETESGEISSRRPLQEKLRCKSFDWYIKNLYTESIIPEELLGSWIQNVGMNDLCLDLLLENADDFENNVVGVASCSSSKTQEWVYTFYGEIQLYNKDVCLDYSGETVSLFPCHGAKGNQLWLYDYKEKLIVHGPSLLCMSFFPDSFVIVMVICDPSSAKQQWNIHNFNPQNYKDPRPKIVKFAPK